MHYFKMNNYWLFDEKVHFSNALHVILQVPGTHYVNANIKQCFILYTSMFKKKFFFFPEKIN